ncbi:MAG: hypothetical protein COU51_00350 [Parcubacteria group bacterium CG10_big_fil_rev_8_21_14_0_10_36_14]|nr:MAG: hypothetical protein COU51_00350 [Parcubacteria group bacterium CG10_big_fil_rev_8_21_14_0_10_36_14]
MERIEFILKAVSHLVWSLILEGLLFIILGILVYIYPALLIVLTAVFFLFTGLTLVSIGLKVRRYSKIKIDF